MVVFVCSYEKPKSTVTWMLPVIDEDANTCINLPVKLGQTPSTQLISKNTENTRVIKARTGAPGVIMEIDGLCGKGPTCTSRMGPIVEPLSSSVSVRWLTWPRSGWTRTGGPGAARRPRLVPTWTWTSLRNTCRSTLWRSSPCRCPRRPRRTWGSWCIPTRAPGSQVSPAGGWGGGG